MLGRSHSSSFWLARSWTTWRILLQTPSNPISEEWNAGSHPANPSWPTFTDPLPSWSWVTSSSSSWPSSIYIGPATRPLSLPAAIRLSKSKSENPILKRTWHLKHLLHCWNRFRVIFSLFILMGVSWMTEIISYAVGGKAYDWFFTDILNILTGVFIFFIFVCKPNVWKLLKLKCPCLKKLDRCCPSVMRTSGGSTRQGTTRSTLRNESSTSKSVLGQHNIGQQDDARRKVSMTPVTNTTQFRDSTQVDSGDEMMMDHESKMVA